tara:strand:+ start:199 stop:615 length:417 start_codon:yes stop_codon:yes gene_type:complete
MAHDSSVYKHTSWGRTRQAKNLAGKHATEITPQTTVPTLATQGFPTETQEHLHMYLLESGNNATIITVYAYTHAFGVWHILQSGGSAVTIAADNTTKLMSGADAVDISGVDRLWFRITTGTHHVDDKFFAAVNTMPGK